MNIEYLYSLTPREFYNIVHGFERDRELRDRVEWERTRWQTVALINIQLDKKYKMKKVTDLVTFSWEQQPETAPVMSKEKRLKMIESWDNEIQFE